VYRVIVRSENRLRDYPKHIDFDLLTKIREMSRDSLIPSWVTRLPREFGSASAGSLKADEWRAVATLYAPLVMIREWASAGEDKKAWLDLTLNLASAIRAATSRTMSQESISLFNHHIHDYLAGIKTLFSDRPWVPNYHAALHLPQFLRSLGPPQGWWTFPFERMIKLLQNIRTNQQPGEASLSSFSFTVSNYRLGQLEKTMGETYFLASRLRRVAFSNAFGAESPELIKVIRDMASNIDSITVGDTKGTLISDVYRYLELTDPDPDSAFSLHPNEPEMSSALANQELNHYKYRGLILGTWDTERYKNNSIIYLHTGPAHQDGHQPYVIKNIIRRENGDIGLAVRKFEACQVPVDPYSHYPLLRAKIWSRSIEERVHIVDISQFRSHAAVWNYGDDECVSMILDRVSHSLSYTTSTHASLIVLLGAMGLIGMTLIRTRIHQ